MATGGQQEIDTTKLVVVAMDFGTTYSGYAFSYHDSPLEINVNKVWSSSSDRLMSLKTPTCVLLTPDRRFHSFGYEAESKYGTLAENNQHHGWYFFRRFKMLLHSKSAITEKTVIRDIAGKELPAVELFAHSIRYLKEHFQRELKNQTGDTFEAHIQYVLTVPAIWDDKAKIFMRKAAVKAGIDGDYLKMALEPEAVSIWCQVYAKESHVDISRKYIVVDLGGGTADITIQESNEDGSLKELHKATGGPWGGMNVDDSFEKMLSQIYGHGVLEHMNTRDMDCYFSIMRTLETQKHNLSMTSAGKVSVRIPYSMLDICKGNGRDIKEQIDALGLTDMCVAQGDKLRVDISVIRELFRYPMKSLVHHLKSLFKQDNIGDVDTILLVGGFAESPIVQDDIRAAFPDKKVIIPPDSGLAVLKGAVRFGHFPKLITGRKSKYSYGLESWPPFDPAKHPDNKIIFKYGKYLCRHSFSEIVAIGEDLVYGKEYVKHRGSAVDVAQVDITEVLYASTNPNTILVDEEGCVKVGEIHISFPHSDKIEDKQCTVALIFWDTEVKFRVQVKNSDKVYEAVFDQL